MSPRKFQPAVLWIALLVVCVPLLQAHEDTLIKLDGSKLVGLPADLSPAELDLKEFRLRIGENELTFPPLLKDFFQQPHDLQVSASWYHRLEILPPYLLIRITPKKKDFSYEILLELRTLDLIKLSVALRESEGSTRHLKVELEDEWKKDFKKLIRKVE